MPQIVSSSSGPQGSVPASQAFADEGPGESPAPAQRPTPSGHPGFPDEPPDVDDSSSSPEAEGKTGSPDKPQSFGQKKESEKQHLSRYERTKQQRQALREREAALAQREAILAQKDAQAKAPKKRDYTLPELKKFRQSWENEGRFDLVESADKEIQAMEAEEKQTGSRDAFVNEWHTAERDLQQADPEFLKSGSRLDAKIREIMEGPDGNVYRGHPRGIVAAYHRARMDLLESDFGVSQKRVQELETENQRLNGLLGISGGSPGQRVGNGQTTTKDFTRMTTSEQGKHLRNSAARSDGGTTWF